MKDRFRKIMTDHGLTQQKMAEMIGIDTSTVSCFCNGKRQPGFEVIAKISSAFPDVDMNWFINGESRALSGATVNGAVGAGSDVENDREQLSLNFNGAPRSGVSTGASTGSVSSANGANGTASSQGLNAGAAATPNGTSGATAGAGSNLNSGVPTGASGAPSAGANLGSLASSRPGDYTTTPSGRRQIKRVILFFEDGGIESYE